MSSTTRSKSVTVSPLHRRCRPSSTRSNSRKERNRLTTDTLNDLAQDPQRIPSFASNSVARSKSAKDFDEEFAHANKESKKQAWAPKPKQNLSSSSTKFQRHGRIETNTDSARKKAHISKDFGRAEDHIYLTDLVKLRKIFKRADSEGDGTVSLDEFLVVFDKLFDLNGKNEEEILAFFNKIDYNCDGYINWADFCTYMQLELQERDDVVVQSKMVEFQLPGEIITQNPHRDSICRISHLSDGMMVTCSQDGVICFWSHDFQPRRIRKAEFGFIGKPKWITDMALCNTISKILLITGDHEIQFYEMINFEPYCQLRKLEAVPLKVDFWSNPDQHDECLILVGDNEGTVTIIRTSNIKEAFKYWKRGAKAENGMPTYSVDKLCTERIVGTSVYRWKLHTNWVSEVHYLPSLHNFASCSCDSNNSVVMGTPSGSTPVEAMLQPSWQIPLTERREDGPQDVTTFTSRPRSYLLAKNRSPGDQRIFKVTKGVSTLDYCSKNGILVTGGLDQIIRLWNPYISSKPVAKLYGQSSPVFKVQVDSSKDRIYSIGNDNNVKVWHLVDHTCLCTVIPSLHKLSSAVECFYYNPLLFRLVLAAEQISVLRISTSQHVRNDIIQTHLHPVTAVKYSQCFNQVITACEGADIKVWDISSGKSIFEFGGDMGKGIGIRTMDVDRAGKRIITGGDNGVIKLWNYSNGHCIRILDKGNSLEATDVKFITLNDNKYIIAAGWDKQIHLFPDLAGRHVHHILKPIDGWSSASAHAHSQDILSIAVGLTNLMATSSFDGEVIVWSVVSCHMLSKLQGTYSSIPLELNEDKAVHRILFLESRVESTKTAATLIASGPYGKVHFWNIYVSERPMGMFRVCHSNACVTDMALDDTDSILVTSDSQGYVAVFNIKNYCTTEKSIVSPPKKIAIWRAHTKRISSILLVDRWNTLVTGSIDGAVRLWTFQGHYIGTFGQEQGWKLGSPSTYLHPLVPEDVLLDKTGLDSRIEHSSHSPAKTTTAANKESSKRSQVDEGQIGNVIATEGMLTVTELGTVEEEELITSHVSIEVPSYGSHNVGKRLRHLRAHSAVKKDDVKSKAVYGRLPCQPLRNDCFQIPPMIEVQKQSKTGTSLYM